MKTGPSRRELLAGMAGCLALGRLPAAEEQGLSLATFQAEVTVPLKHPLMGGGIAPARTIEDPLFTHGLVLLGAGKPVVLAVVDWCEIRNDAFDRWRGVLAEAARTTPERVLVSSVHQHDAPVADLEAQRLLQAAGAKGAICDLDFHETTVQRVGRALREALKTPRPVTHIGTGQAQVKEVASNRRFVLDGKVLFGRTSATRDPRYREQPEGTIDPWLKTLSFWDGDKELASLSVYATHPMSYYGKGGVSADFVGLARKRRQAEAPAGSLPFYGSGCSGNVTAGKYNDGAADNRPILAERIYQAMVAAGKVSKRQPLRAVGFRSVPLRLEPRNDKGFTVEDLQQRLKEDPKPFGQCLAALGLSWRKRADAGHKLDVPVLELGEARLVLLPAEAYVEYQLLAQRLRPDLFVVTLGYGECAPGYIPTARAVEERDGNLSDWCWVAPGAEQAMTAALERALGKKKD